MVTPDGDDRQRLDRWLSLIRGPALIGPADVVFPRRARAIAEMHAAGADRLFPLLRPMLSDPDPAARFAACEAAFYVDAGRAVELALPLLADPEAPIRRFVCECLHYARDERTIGPLIAVLQGDSSAGARGAAAYALGRMGGPAALPALAAAMESDHEVDGYGHSVSSQAATALDDILGTDETRIKLPNGNITMRSGKPDLDLLRRLAAERFRQWSSGRAEPGAAADRASGR